MIASQSKAGLGSASIGQYDSQLYWIGGGLGHLRIAIAAVLRYGGVRLDRTGELDEVFAGRGRGKS